MSQTVHISSFISRIAISFLLLLLSCVETRAQLRLGYERDSIPLFRGFAMSFDMAGFAEKMLGSHGQIEGALRLNLHDQYFPIVELGYGIANHANDAVTSITYKTRAPYFRVGADVNIMNKKHTGNRVFLGIRYGFTHYKVDISHPLLKDPVWKYEEPYNISGEPCTMQWGEVLFGLDAKIVGPIHLGWSGRYRFRLSHKDGIMEKTWYVPGYGKQDSSALGYSFYISFDI
jgi:hypothetical protein